jgi:hypothetical protein
VAAGKKSRDSGIQKLDAAPNSSQEAPLSQLSSASARKKAHADHGPAEHPPLGRVPAGWSWQASLDRGTTCSCPYFEAIYRLSRLQDTVMPQGELSHLRLSHRCPSHVSARHHVGGSAIGTIQALSLVLFLRGCELRRSTRRNTILREIPRR